MRAIFLIVTLTVTVSTAFAAAPRQALQPVANTLCPLQGSAVNANCPIIKAQEQALRACLPELSGSSETSTSKSLVERERNGRNS